VEKSKKDVIKPKVTKESIKWNELRKKDAELKNSKRFSIPEYDVDVEFARDIIQVLDCSTEKLLDSKNMDDKEMIKLEAVVRRSFSSFKAKSESGKNYLVNLNFVREHDVLSTGGEYILDISMAAPDHGFYFGLYEIGEFTVNQNDLTMNLVNSYPCKYVGAGVTTPGELTREKKRILYFGLRETEGDSVSGTHRYYAVKMEWSSEKSESQKIVWKKPLPAAVMSMLIQNNLLFIGLKNGDVQIIDLNTDTSKSAEEQKSEVITYKGAKYLVIEKSSNEPNSHETKIEKVLEEVTYEKGPELIFNQKLFAENGKEGEVTEIEFLSDSSRIAVVGGIRQQVGSVAIFSCKGELLLNTHLGDSIIKGISQTPLGLFLTNVEGLMYHFQTDFMEGGSTKSITKVKLDKEMMSNIVVVRDWICGSGAETLFFIFSKDVRKRSTSHLDDTLARCVVAHEFGIISGDDIGKLRFWKIGDIEVHEE
jgi:hypothetical protein